MGATVGEFDEVDWGSAAGTALKVCRAWGYSGAAAFSGVRERCVTPYCGKKEILRTYQCID